MISHLHPHCVRPSHHRIVWGGTYSSVLESIQFIKFPQEAVNLDLLSRDDIERDQNLSPPRRRT